MGVQADLFSPQANIILIFIFLLKRLRGRSASAVVTSRPLKGRRCLRGDGGRVRHGSCCPEPPLPQRWTRRPSVTSVLGWAEEAAGPKRRELILSSSSVFSSCPDVSRVSSRSAAHRPWTSCGCCLSPCSRRAWPFRWMRRRGVTACSPVSPSRCACARGCLTTPPSCPTSSTTTTSKRPPSPWR